MVKKKKKIKIRAVKKRSKSKKIKKGYTYAYSEKEYIMKLGSWSPLRKESRTVKEVVVMLLSYMDHQEVPLYRKHALTRLEQLKGMSPNTCLYSVAT